MIPNNLEANTLRTLHTSKDMNEFTGKRALVTGGTKGIGEATVHRLLRGGATVLAAAHKKCSCG
jgi:3-oxoacyl-ACP reductase-like protein